MPYRLEKVDFSKYEKYLGSAFYCGRCPNWDFVDIELVPYDLRDTPLNPKDIILYLGQDTFWHLRFNAKIFFTALREGGDWQYHFRSIDYEPWDRIPYERGR